MKKLLAILHLTLLSLSLAFAQSGLYISLEGGLAAPLGSFGANADILTDGYAKAGMDGIAGIGYRISENFAVGAKLAYMHNKLEGPNNIFPNVTPWKSTGILGSVTYSYPLNESLYLDGDVNAGYWITQFPEANISGGNRSADTGNGFGYGVGIGAKYMLAEDFAFELSVNYFGSNPSYDSGILTFSQNIHILAINWGIIFQL